MKVILTDEEVDEVVYFVDEILKRKKENRINNNKIGTKSSWHYDMIGFCGEVAVFKMLGLNYVYKHYRVADNYDIELGEYRFDIKTSTYKVASIQDWHLNKKEVDGFIFVQILNDYAYNEFEVLGVMSKKVFSEKSVQRGAWLNVDLIALTNPKILFKLLEQ
jgi:hypothetical protein